MVQPTATKSGVVTQMRNERVSRGQPRSIPKGQAPAPTVLGPLPTPKRFDLE